MKNKELLSLFAVLLFFNLQCNQSKETFEPPRVYGVQVDKPSINFPSEGGIDTITAPTLKRWNQWNISGGVEYQLEDGEWREGIYTPATSSQYGDHDVLEGSWFHALIPDSGFSNQVIVVIDTNYTYNPRQVRILLGLIPNVTSIKIEQN